MFAFSVDTSYLIMEYILKTSRRDTLSDSNTSLVLAPSIRYLYRHLSIVMRIMIKKERSDTAHAGRSYVTVVFLIVFFSHRVMLIKN